MEENKEPAARELVVSAWRDYQLNLAVEKRSWPATAQC